MSKRIRTQRASFLLVVFAVLVYIALCAIFNPGVPATSYLLPACVLVLATIMYLNVNRVSEFVREHPKEVVIAILIVTACLATGLPKLTFNVELRSYLPPSYESARTTLEVENMLGGVSSEVILLYSDNLLDPACVAAAHNLRVALENELDGYLVARLFWYLEPIERELGENFPTGPELENRLRQLLSDPTILGEVEPHIRRVEPELAENFRIVRGKEGKQVARLVYRVAKMPSWEEISYAKKLERIVKSCVEDSGYVFEATVGGDHSTSKDLMRTIEEERIYLFGTAGILVSLCLFLTFRKPRDILLALFTIGLAIAWVVCLMGWLGIEFSPVVVGVFPLLIGLGIDYSVYMNYRYSEERLKGRGPGLAAGLAIATVGTAIYLSCMTTMFGYGSWLTSPMEPLFDFGALSMAGIGFAYMLSVTFLPSCRILLDRGVRKGELVDRFSARALETGLSKLAVVVERHAKWFLVGAVIVTLLAAYSAMHTRTALEWEKMTPQGMESLETSDLYLKLWPEYNPMGAILVMVKGDIASPETLRCMDQIQTYAPQRCRYVTDAWSIVDFVKQKNGGILPSTRERVVEILSELSEPTYASLISPTYDRTIMFITTYTTTDQEVLAATENVRYLVEKYGQVENTKFLVGGLPAIGADLLSELVPSQLRTTLIALIGCFLILWAVFRNPKEAGICMVPVVLTVVWGLGMFWPLDIPINIVTVLVSAILIGIGIDYAIHVRHRYVEELSKGRSIKHAIRETMVRIGGAVFGAATTSLSAMGTLMASRMPAIAVFGKMIALEFVACLCAVFFVLPALLVWLTKRGSIRVTT